MSLVDQLLEDTDAILDDLRMHLLQAQQKMKHYADEKCHHEEFEVGQMILLKLQPHRQHSLAHQKSEKLAPSFYEPYKLCSS